MRVPPWARSTFLTLEIQWTRRPLSVLAGADLASAGEGEDAVVRMRASKVWRKYDEVLVKLR